MSNLIYFNIGGNIKWVECLKLCVESLEKWGKYTQDYLIIIPDNFTVNPSIFKEEIKRLNVFGSKEAKIFSPSVLKCQKCPLNPVFGRFAVYQYEDIKKYDKVLYMDIDIIAINMINDIFYHINNKISVYNEWGLMTDHTNYWGNTLLSSDEKNDVIKNNIFGINSGLFGFVPSTENLNTLKYVCDIGTNPNAITCVVDQPSFNYALYKTKNYEALFTNFVSNRVHINNKTELQKHIDDKKVLLHFNGNGIFNAEKKYNIMKIIKDL